MDVIFKFADKREVEFARIDFLSLAPERTLPFFRSNRSHYSSCGE